jgi:hypothetical protein
MRFYFMPLRVSCQAHVSTVQAQPSLSLVENRQVLSRHFVSVVQIPAFLKWLQSLQSLDLSGNRIAVLENLHLPTGMQI